MIGEWVALPLIHLAGSTKPGDEAWQQIQYPIAHALLERCDAVFRIKGDSKGADNDVKLAMEKGLKIYYKIEDVPDQRH
jgi:hypothetical protein